MPLAASLERSSEHPLAAAIVTAARDRNASIQEPTDFASVTGKGVTGKIGGRQVALGNAKLMADLGITFGDLEHKADELRSEGATALFLTIDQKPEASSPLPTRSSQRRKRPSIACGDYGIRIVMLTGDNKTTAEAVARKLGIEEVEADILPQDKNRIVKKLTAEGRIVAMAGDGVNDAPALAEAAVGIAMGTGTEVAIQSAGITLVKRGSCRHCAGHSLEPSDHAKHTPKSGICIRLQRDRHPDCRRCPLPGLRPPSQSDHRRACDVAKLGVGDHELTALAHAEA